MNQEQKIEERLEVENYLQNKKVYEIFQAMLQDLMTEQPADPITSMISHLTKPENSVNLLIGPPGLHLFSIAQEVLNDFDKSEHAAFNCGNFVASIESSLPQEAKDLFAQSRLLPESLVGDKILREVVTFCEKNKHSIIEGFPKTLSQAISLQQQKIIPERVIFVNVSKKDLLGLCVQKIRKSNPNLETNQIQEKAKSAVNEYQILNKDLKAFYPSYLEIDASRNSDKAGINSEIKKCLSLHFGWVQPRRNTRIVILGAPYSGRTTLGKKIAQKYNLIYVSSAVLVAEEIRKDSVMGRKLKEKYLSNEMVDNISIEKLIEERISKKDCQMQGYVLEGYPKNEQQLENLKNLHIYPDFLVGINPTEEVLSKRAGQNQELFKARMEKWHQFSKCLTSCSNIFWVDPSLDIQNSFQNVCFEVENRKI